ncbi:transcription termination factor MTERF8, chloroplastic-like [Zingiber officinale]|uniref:transcription termination factor MTERF8, chloroplastic-like n=1 Tax=Zingiber officinale TaxID=94328 RepID=UPI001C4BC42E|nr:transcription termination factor MTERF8, chloroplastic-like [Zingiber officinale]
MLLHSAIRRHALLPLSRLFFSTSTSSPLSGGGISSRDPHFMVEFLVNSCGFSMEEASKASKPLAHLQSTENPEAVLAFFRSQESDLVYAILNNPTIMSLNVQHTLLPRLNVWESLFGSRELLLKNLRKRYWFLSSNIENVVRPNLNFLRDECDIPLERASLILKIHPTFIVQNPNSLRALVDRAEGMGFTRRSRIFLWILDILSRTSREKVDAHSKLMNSFGWSDSEFCTAIEKQPNIMHYSTDLLRIKMEFLIKDIGLTPSDIASRPKFLALSLKKRLIPRFQVMKILESEELWTSKGKLNMFFIMPDPKFMKKYILPYKDKFPKLLEILCAVAE